MRQMFSKKQIEEIVKNVAKAGELDFSDVDMEVGSLDANGLITGGEIVEKMTGYSFIPDASLDAGFTINYAGVVKNGNKLTFALAITAYFETAPGNTGKNIGEFSIPTALFNKLVGIDFSGYTYLDIRNIQFAYSSAASVQNIMRCMKREATVQFNLRCDNFSAHTTYYGRVEVTFLLSDSLAE